MNNNNSDHQPANFELDLNAAVVNCSGAWVSQCINRLDLRLSALKFEQLSHLTIDGKQVSALDTVGAWLFNKLIKRCEQRSISVELKNFDQRCQQLISFIQPHRAPAISEQKIVAEPGLTQLGRKTVNLVCELVGTLTFVGEVTVFCLSTLLRPFRIPWRQTMVVIEEMGYKALPIIALLCFLIGVVLAYQMGQQLRNYGADIFIVDLIGIAVLREFGPLITAIILAGRTGSAFTAQIGSMKVHEEIDALKTMGVGPIEMLVVPRIYALLIVVPLLTVWADFFGVFGGMVMAKSILGLDFYNFLDRFKTAISLRTYVMGMIKAPFFALVIAGVGCYHGFQVKGGADSVGRETTRSVVHAIFLIIIVDAIFSVIFSWQNM